ncbi:MAG: exo-alpha-sialidase [Sphingomonadales bacterium]|nr:exo-alpha-sialidase [Sphingomonadales bacterium]
MRLLREKRSILLNGFFFSYLLLTFSFFIKAQQVVFTAGESGYASFRIPAIVKAPNGDLLAVCEGRVRHAGDFGNIDLVLKRSLDNGRTWSSLQVIVDVDSLQAGNPAPVVDRLDPAYPQGRIFIFYNTGNNHENEVRKGNGVRQVWYITSIDQGRSWSAPINISSQVHRQGPPDNWRSYANTPGHGLQIERGAYRGRLYIAANHSAGKPVAAFKDYQAHGFYSDDHGQTFLLSESVLIPGSNESTAAELSRGRLLLNSRNQSGEQRLRIVSMSSNGGKRWDSTYFDTQLIDPVCQGSLLNIGWYRGLAVLAFSNAASRVHRDSLTLRISKDEGRTWFRSLLVDRQPDLRTGETRKDYTAYSDLVLIDKNRIGILYERNDYREIVFTLLLLRRDYTPRLN